MQSSGPPSVFVFIGASPGAPAPPISSPKVVLSDEELARHNVGEAEAHASARLLHEMETAGALLQALLQCNRDEAAARADIAEAQLVDRPQLQPLRRQPRGPRSEKKMVLKPLSDLPHFHIHRRSARERSHAPCAEVPSPTSFKALPTFNTAFNALVGTSD